MKRRLLRIAAAVSLALCVGMIALGAESVRFDEGIGARWSGRTHFTFSHSGVIYVGAESVGTPGTILLHRRTDDRPGLNEPGVLGFKYLTRPGNDFAVGIPIWFLASSLALLGFVLHRKARRLSMVQGLCRKCGYDLRATPDRCPECGTAVMSSK